MRTDGCDNAPRQHQGERVTHSRVDDDQRAGAVRRTNDNHSPAATAKAARKINSVVLPRAGVPRRAGAAARAPPTARPSSAERCSAAAGLVLDVTSATAPPSGLHPSGLGRTAKLTSSLSSPGRHGGRLRQDPCQERARKRVLLAAGGGAGCPGRSGPRRLGRRWVQRGEFGSGLEAEWWPPPRSRPGGTAVGCPESGPRSGCHLGLLVHPGQGDLGAVMLRRWALSLIGAEQLAL